MWTIWFVVGLVQATTTVCYYPNATLIALSGGSSLISSNPQTGGVQKSFSIADVTLSMQTNGSITVTQSVNGQQSLLWSSNSNRDCTPECRLVSQGDGNIVAYDRNGAYWGSGTCYVEQGAGCSGTPQQIILSAYYPYFFTPDKNCNVTWKISGAKNRTGSVVSTYNTASASVFPKPLSTFYNSFGVCTHISQGQNYRDVITAAKFIGASTIRDSAGAGAISVGLAGIKLDLGAGTPANKSELQKVLADIKNTHIQSNYSVVSIEGANEINNWPFVYNGVDYHSSCAGYAQYQSDLYSLVKGDAAFNGVAVYDLTAGNEGMDCAAQGMLKLTGKADFANVHSYTYQYPIVTTGGSSYNAGMDHDFTGWNASTPRVITEVGVHTYITSAGDGVDNNTQAKLVVGALFNAIADGYSKAFLYQLIDQYWSGYTGSQSWFGLYDGYLNPKSAPKVFNQISKLLQENGSNTVPLKSLAFGLGGTSQNVRSFLFQSQSRANLYYLAIWQNLAVWNPTANTPYLNPTLPVAINLGSGITGNFTVYNPFYMVGVPASGTPLVAKTATKATYISVNVADYVQIVQISVMYSTTNSSSSSSSGAVGAAPSIPDMSAPGNPDMGTIDTTNNTTNNNNKNNDVNRAFGGAHLNGLAAVFCGLVGFLFY